MSTTHSISDIGKNLVAGLDYTVVGTGRSDTAEQLLSVLVLHRGGRIDREGLFRSLSERHKGEIISIETAEHSYDIERLSQRHSAVRFLIPGVALNTGAQINLGIYEARSPYVLVIWNDTRLAELGERALQRAMGNELLCCAPYIRNERGQVIPTVMTPVLESRGNLRILPQAPFSEFSTTLFPYDYVAVYRRDRFLDMFGYDGAMERPYWQKLEFGLRSWMWGESMRVSSSLRLSYTGTAPEEDTTPDVDYLRFYWKTLGVKIGYSGGELSKSRLLGGLLRSPGSIPALLSSYREVGRELQAYRNRYRRSAHKLISQWESTE